MSTHDTLRRLLPAVLIGLAVCGHASAQTLRPRAAVIKPVRTVMEPYHRADVIRVKFHDDAPVRPGEDGTVTDFGTGALEGADLSFLDGAEWRPMVELPEPDLEAMRHAAQQTLGRAVADFRVWFHVFLPEDLDAAETIDALNALDCVELAEPVQVAAPAPTPPPYGGLQHYLNAGPLGMGAMATWEHLGTRGGGAVIVDIEFGYDGHQDLPTINQIGPPGDPATQSERDHGTASLGVMGSLPNGWGTTGVAPDAWFGFAAVKSGGVVNMPAAILNATSWTGVSGAIILIEQQLAGPAACGNPCSSLGLPPCDCSAGTAWVPVEWDLATYNAILTAVGNGKTVIEPAGNGAQDLDAAVYSTGNNGHWPFLPQNDSGAIMVGAGHGLDFFDTPGSRICCSNYGSRVDVQGHGWNVKSTGYGDMYNAEGPSLHYTASFAGTSSASAIIAGTAALVQSAYFIANSGPQGQVWMSPSALRQVLKASGAPQQPSFYYNFPVTQNIGPVPDASIAILLAVGGCLPLYDTTVGNPGLNNDVYALETFDDGNGAELYAAGNFSNAGGGAAPGVASWDGSTWSAVTNPGLGAIWDLEVHDDGSGPALFAAGGSGLAPNGSGGVARWNGSSWTTLGGTDGAVVSLGVYNGDLFAGGNFTDVGGTTVSNIARWDGTSWSTPGGGVDDTVNALQAYNDGGGVALYAGGDFGNAGGGPASYIAKWDGSSWTALGSGLSGPVLSLEVFHDGTTLELYAGGWFHFGTGPFDYVARWNGVQWSPLGSQLYNGTFNGVSDMVVYDDGTGPALFLGGAFEQAEDVWSPHVAKWDGTRFWALGDGISGGVNALAVYDDGGGPTLFMGGGFSTVWDLSSSNIVEYTGCPVSVCAGDLDGDGVVGILDFLTLLAAWGPNPGHPADLDGDGVVGILDFLILLGNWGFCP